MLVMVLQDPGNLLTGNANGYVGGQIYFDAFNVSLPVLCIASAQTGSGILHVSGVYAPTQHWG